ncbi:hypothetical protein APUTEX25_004809 [Auxenochlorella protothecoides]|uniref:Uncharacterized protein n=1 Tax=Auxenochlorella protothecoides TaxID=3075 RepID=A0A3M7KS23_AUXPR|nr:hypothetical protein APUTEX25_004809 [Auxenochlorella protothecoides]|eukprot:RMZ53321.1 hypothetical protein APUTEX25_004809 [Auxenochlorella protothecoides]
MRGQLPGPYHQLQLTAGTAGEGLGPRDRSQLRQAKALAGLDALLCSITPLLFSTSIGTQAVLLLGRSPARPLEAITFRFPPARLDPEPECTGTRDRGSARQEDPCQQPHAHEGLSRCAMRQFLMQVAGAESGVTSPCRAFLLLRGPRAAHAPGFRPNQTWRPAQRKGLAIDVSLGQGSEDGASEAVTMEPATLPWLQCAARVKGLG